MSLIESLKNKDYAPTSKQWVQFIQDHINFLKEKSKKVILSVNTMNTYRYKPNAFLASQQVKYEIFWVVLLINRILNPVDFNNISIVYIPTANVIYDLKVKFNTFLKLQQG